jgi:hypothetical protein
MILRQALAEAYEHCIAQGRCQAKDVVEEAQHRHPDLFSHESARLVHQAALREAKAFMKEAYVLSEEDVDSTNQAELPLGLLPGMPAPRTLIVAIAPGEYVHVRYDCATWADMEAALLEKGLNIDRAIARKDDHILKMDALRRYLAPFSHRTIAEAYELMRKDQQQPGAPTP